MASRRPNRNENEYADLPKPKRRKNTHQVSDSDDEYDDSDEDQSSIGQFGDPNGFLNKYGGYDTDNSQDEDDQGIHPIRKRQYLIRMKLKKVSPQKTYYYISLLLWLFPRIRGGRKQGGRRVFGLGRRAKSPQEGEAKFEPGSRTRLLEAPGHR